MNNFSIIIYSYTIVTILLIILQAFPKQATLTRNKP